MKAERNAFNVMLGDTIYSDSEVPGRLNPIALSVQQKWAKYRVNLGNPSLRALRGSAGFYSHWDDHEFVNDFSPAENSFDNDVNVERPHALQPRRAGVPRLRAGPLDEPRRPLPHACAGATTWSSSSSTSARSAAPTPTRAASATTRRPDQPDLAPTAPQTTRNLFALVDAVARRSRCRRRASTASGARTGPSSAGAS